MMGPWLLGEQRDGRREPSPALRCNRGIRAPKTVLFSMPQALPPKEATGRLVPRRFESPPVPSSFWFFHLFFFTVGFMKRKGRSFLKPSAAGSPLRSSSNPAHAGEKKNERFCRAQLKAGGFSPLSSPPSRGTKFSGSEGKSESGQAASPAGAAQLNIARLHKTESVAVKRHR